MPARPKKMGAKSAMVSAWMRSLSAIVARGALPSSTPKTNAPSRGCRPSSVVAAAEMLSNTSTSESSPLGIPVTSATRRIAQKVNRRPRVNMKAKNRSASPVALSPAVKALARCCTDDTMEISGPHDHLARDAGGQHHLRIIAPQRFTLDQQLGHHADRGYRKHKAQKECTGRIAPEDLCANPEADAERRADCSRGGEQAGHHLLPQDGEIRLHARDHQQQNGANPREQQESLARPRDSETAC